MIDGYLEALTRKAVAVLGSNLLGAYASGSVALGGYEPGRSDVDVALVVERALDRATKERVVQELSHESLPCPARGLELVVYRSDVTRSGTSRPGFEVELNTGSGIPFKATYDGADATAEDGRFWYAVDRSIVREHGVPLMGPPPRELFGEVEDLYALLAESLRWHLDHDAVSADAVLGACRALVRIRSGRWVTKTAAGRELASTEPDVVRASLRARLDQGPAPAADAARAFQVSVLRELEQYAI